MGPTWGPFGADRTQVGPMLAPWTLLSGVWCVVLGAEIRVNHRRMVTKSYCSLQALYHFLYIIYALNIRSRWKEASIAHFAIVTKDIFSMYRKVYIKVSTISLNLLLYPPVFWRTRTFNIGTVSSSPIVLLCTIWRKLYAIFVNAVPEYRCHIIRQSGFCSMQKVLDILFFMILAWRFGGKTVYSFHFMALMFFLIREYCSYFNKYRCMITSSAYFSDCGSHKTKHEFTFKPIPRKSAQAHILFDKSVNTMGSKPMISKWRTSYAFRQWVVQRFLTDTV